MITVPAPAGISQPGVPEREFSRCTGLAAVKAVAGAVEDVLLLLDPPHALRTSATIVALTARKRVYGMASVAPVDPGRLSILSKKKRHRA
ncbi:MAG TPA: hypothetical protein VE777_00955, partial [Gaiellales bacterium]|nr:hypothetical protein [Gaiellales bacterium]